MRVIVLVLGALSLSAIAAFGLAGLIMDTPEPQRRVQVVPDADIDQMANFTALAEPRPVPEISFIDGAGRARTLADFRGQLLLVNLWATWCAPCRREMPALDRLQAKLGGPRFRVLALAVDRGGIDKVRAFFAETGVRNLEPFIDKTTKSLHALGAVGLPTTLIVDGRGRELGRLAGPAEWDGEDAIGLIRRYLEADMAQAAD